MMSTRRFLLTFGALLAAFALLSPGSALAQDVTADSVRVTTGTSTGAIVVAFAGDSVGALDMFEIQYRVYSASNTANQGWMAHATVGATATKSTVTGLDHNKMYEARVRVVVDSTGNPSDWVVSTDDSATTDVDESRATPAAPEKPVRVASPSVTPGDEMLDVEWLEPASELEINLYRVYYMAKGGASKTKLVLAPATSVTLTSLENDVEYTIEVSAESDAGEGPKSRKVTATPKEGAGGSDDGDDDGMAPAVPKISKVTAGDGQLMVMWGMVEGATMYEARAVAGGSTVIESTEEMSATFMNLTNGMEYMVSVRAGNADGYSDWSEAMAGTPMMADATPTPALPLFGAFALGAGLVAAGRARLRRRQALEAARVRGQLGR